MADLEGIVPTGIPDLGGFSPSTEPAANAEKVSKVDESIHIRVQQRNGRKSLTTIQVHQ